MTNDHFIPVMLLRNFAFGEEDEDRKKVTFMLNKSNLKEPEFQNIGECYKEITIGKILRSNNFYSKTLDDWFRMKYEGPCASLFKNIIATKKLDDLKKEEIILIKKFILIQYLRTYQYRERIKKKTVEDSKNIQEMEIKFIESNIDFFKEYGLHLIVNLSDLKIILSDGAVLDLGKFAINHNMIFLLDEDKSKDPQIYLPLSPELALVLRLSKKTRESHLQTMLPNKNGTFHFYLINRDDTLYIRQMNTLIFRNAYNFIISREQISPEEMQSMYQIENQILKPPPSKNFDVYINENGQIYLIDENNNGITNKVLDYRIKDPKLQPKF